MHEADGPWTSVQEQQPRRSRGGGGAAAGAGGVALTYAKGPPPHSHLPGNSLAEASFSSLLSVCLAVSCECVLDFYQPSKQLASYTGKNI